MNIPPYFKQENTATCSLAVLRMVLGHHGIKVNETELLEKVKADYGETFSNIWNPTIARLASEYGILTLLCADWPLLKANILPKALFEYKKDPIHFDIHNYENPHDADTLPEPLPLAYKELFLAIEKGCKTEFGSLTQEKVSKFLILGNLIQTSIKLQLMYPGSKHRFHSILLYGIEDNNVFYHDPSRGNSLSCSLNQLIKATTDVGAFMVYEKNNP